MKSIREKSLKLYPVMITDSDDWDVIEEQCDRDDQRKAFVLGANYVLECIEEIIRWDKDPRVIEALKERIWRLKQ